ncbi:MAG: low specificity L-threonine aldolase [Eubacterium sp.]|nr:low specificity L-threonine aldolase [Eubacterium sp.]
MDSKNKLWFASDYQEGACRQIIEKLVETNYEHSPGYGTDDYCNSARDRIREACGCPGAEVHFLSGGTQTNQLMIDTALRPWQGVIAAETGHIATHEAGAIEFTGHKVLALPHHLGKLTSEAIDEYVQAYYGDDNHDHMVAPGMVYLSHPTEYGTIYSKEELTKIREVCDRHGLLLYLDGARLGYALACLESDLTLYDLARLCDIFYIGGTKCGALFGEAVVIPRAGLIPHLFTMIKQHGALLAKGRMLGLQFDVLFTDDLYKRIAANAIAMADQIRQTLREKGYQFYFENPTNQIFIVVSDDKLAELAEHVEYGFWEKYDETHTVIRLATSWATSGEDVEKLAEVL